jgi:F-type H+-transporting ATPase subunit gamma
MSTFKEIEDNLEAVSAIKTIATTYQEISQKEMTKIREKALKNRKFIGRLAQVYAKTKEEHLKNKEEEKAPSEEKSGKVAVFLSANARFYGSLLWEVWSQVKKYLEKNDADLVVVAENGKFFAQNSPFGENFTYFDLDDEEPEEGEIKEIIDFIKKYKKISIFHGHFENILKQDSVRTEIPGKLPKKETKEEESYLFEPSTKEVLQFFETELLTAFFNQAFLEHRLSRHATRVVAMHQAGENAKERKEDLKMTIKRLKRKEMDKKQFDITGPLQLWD